MSEATKRRIIGLTLIAGLLGPACAAPDEGGAVATDELGRAEVAPGKYFVGFKTSPGASHRALVTTYGGRISREFALVRAFSVDIEAGRVGDLARDNAIEYVEPVPMRYAHGLGDEQLVPALDNGLYGLVKIGATAAHARGILGEGVIVGVGDTRLDCGHPDIERNLIEAENFVGDGLGACFDDGETHGTHVAGTILGIDNRVGVIGVAPSAQLLHARVLGPEGGTTEEVMNGVQWLVDNGAQVVNLSLGGGTRSRTEEAFFNAIRAGGVLVVAAAGNESRNKLSYPAGYQANIAVGAIDVNDALASFSNTGRGLDVVAPGVNVLSSVPEGYGSEASVTGAGATHLAFGLEFAGTTGRAGVSGTLVNCGIGQPTDFPAGVSGNIAVIQRGTLSFAQKVQNAQAAGAAAAVIYNNVPGDFAGTLGAPGTWIPAVSVSDSVGAALVAGGPGNVTNQISSWDYFSGTSMATPHTAGTIALVWSAFPSLTPNQVEARLFNTADDLGAPGYETTFGHGRIDADQATQ